MEFACQGNNGKIIELWCWESQKQMQQDLYDLCSVMPSDLEHLDEVLTSLTCCPQSLLQDPCQLSTMSALTNQLPLLVDQFFCTSSCSLQQVLPHCLILKLPPSHLKSHQTSSFCLILENPYQRLIVLLPV